MWLWLPVAWGSTPIDRTVEASAEVVEITVVCGEVKVVGSDRKGVRVSGTVDDPAGLVIAGEGGPFALATRDGPNACAHLTIEVPAASALEVSTRSASVVIEGSTGCVEVESISGGVTTSGSPSSLEVETVSGSIRITGGKRLEVASVSGSIEVREATGEVSAETVSGNVTASGAGLSAVEVESVSGGIELTLGLAPGGRVEGASHSGRVLARLPADLDARLELSTFSGKLRSAFGSGEDQTAGNGRGRIELASFSGDVVVERVGADAP